METTQRHTGNSLCFCARRVSKVPAQIDNVASLASNAGRACSNILNSPSPPLVEGNFVRVLNLVAFGLVCVVFEVCEEYIATL